MLRARVLARRQPAPTNRRRRRVVVGAGVGAVLTLAGLAVAPQLGSAAAASQPKWSPIGAAAGYQQRPGGLQVSGWTYDPSSARRAISVYVTVGGHRRATFLANRPRTDVARAHPSAGGAHGFLGFVPVPEGTHTVCVWADNIGKGADLAMRCRKRTLNYGPQGSATVTQESGRLRVRGWTYDADAPTRALTMTLRVDRQAPRTLVAGGSRPDVAKAHPSAGARHGFDLSLALAEGTHTVCLTARNVGYGHDRSLVCGSVRLNFTPTAKLAQLTATRTGLSAQGWAADPDTSAPVTVHVSVDKRLRATSSAKLSTPHTKHPHHNFLVPVPTTSGRHTVCVTALNLRYGTHNSSASCKTVTLALSPAGHFDSVTRARGSNNLAVTGWAFDADSSAATSVTISVDKRTVGTYRATASRPDVARAYPSAGATRGLAVTVPATDREHTVCLTARNVGGGKDTSLGCKIINAVHPVAPSAVRSVHAAGGYGTATVSWTAPVSDGGAPWSKFVVVASPGGRTVTTSSSARSATVSGLASNAVYKFSVRAVNVAGYSSTVYSSSIRTQSGPPLQKTPAPVSTSRYIRNIRTGSSAELAAMRREGAADAKANPSGHRYLSLLDIGGQNGSYGGVVLSATTRFVSYANLVKCVKAYLDGYHSAQHSSAPVTVAVGTNNDMDVSASTGRAWATAVVNPLVSYAHRYSGIAVVGANDVEPGFRAGYTAVRNWLSGYLSATSAHFVFNGSADGCAWTVANRGCNNGWSMAGLYTLAGGASSSRIVNLPQVYNYTMADQWKYISLTGVNARKPRINFGGPLTEYTACAQARSCGSIGGRSAWSRMWHNLQSHPKLRVSSLPYSTDLRIDS